MPVTPTVEEHIEIDGYVFDIGPQAVSRKPTKLASSKRALSGKMRTTYMTSGTPGEAIVKWHFEIRGISFHQAMTEQVDEVFLKFKKAGPINFLSTDGLVYSVVFLDYSTDQDAVSPIHPTYSITMDEV